MVFLFFAAGVIAGMAASDTCKKHARCSHKDKPLPLD